MKLIQEVVQSEVINMFSREYNVSEDNVLQMIKKTQFIEFLR